MTVNRSLSACFDCGREYGDEGEAARREQRPLRGPVVQPVYPYCRFDASRRRRLP